MANKWSLRQILAKTSDGGPEGASAEESASLAGTIEFGDFTLDLEKRAVTLRGQELRVTSEEFDVLVFLASHPQSVITPRTVLATSWTAHRVRQTEFLKALVSLRGKLDAAAGPGKHYLRTEPWIVYRFDPSSLSTV
jgi:two-component system KDP operon response regulator KdpE